LKSLPLFFFLLSAPVLAESPQSYQAYSTPVLAEGKADVIQFVGLKRLEPFVLRSVIQLEEGDELNEALVRQDIYSIYQTGYVDNVVVDLQINDEGIQTLTFFITEKPAIRAWTLKGNKKLDDDALTEVIDIAPLSIYNPSDVKQCIQSMREKYIEKGYYLVEIDPVVTEAAEDLIDLEFTIKEGRKVLIQNIDITGNEAMPDQKVTRFMQTKKAGLVPWLTSSGTFDEYTLDDDSQVIRSVYLEEGYVDVKVSKPRTFLSLDKKYIQISIDLTEGPQYVLGSIKTTGEFVSEEGLTKEAVRQIIEGDNAKYLQERFQDASKGLEEGSTPDSGWEKPKRKWLDFRTGHPELKTGDTFKLSSLQMAMQEITKLYADQGYAFVNVIPLTEPDPESSVVDITFDIRKGEKVRIGRIDITGNDPTFDKVVRREIPINEGDLYSGSALDESRMRLERLGFFEEINISTPRSSEDDVLDMKVNVSEKPTGSFSVGAGFSNLENFVFTANVSKNNFMGLGYVMSVAANVSSARQQGNLQLFDPYFLDSRWTFRVNGYSISRQFIEDEYQRGGTVAFGRYLDRRDDVRLEFDYTFEDTGLTSIDAYKQRLLGGQLYRNGLTSTGGISLLADKRNNRISATKGIYLVASANLSGGVRVNDEELLQLFGGEFNFYELRMNLRAYQPLDEKQRFIFRYNGTLGHLGSTDGTVIPYIHRYRAGGINSVRGYDWYTLGPYVRAFGYKSSSRSAFLGSDDPTAADDRLVVGGTETWINNFEIESPIVRQAGISTVFFFDAGNAFGDPWGEGNINVADLRMAYGMGVRWLSPMGPLRFEWGFPVSPYPDERKAVFDFSMGSLF
jgi:outer membrane protein insertion porin family